MNKTGIDIAAYSFKLLLNGLLNKEVPAIDVEELADNLHHYILLDAREEEEFKVSHLLNARHIGFNKMNYTCITNISTDTPIVVYCSVGKRSELITKILMDRGYKNVKNLYGGLFEWVNRGLKVYNEHNQVTQEIHTYNNFWGKWLKKGIKITQIH